MNFTKQEVELFRETPEYGLYLHCNLEPADYELISTFIRTRRQLMYVFSTVLFPQKEFPRLFNAVFEVNDREERMAMLQAVCERVNSLDAFKPLGQRSIIEEFADEGYDDEARLILETRIMVANSFDLDKTA